MAKRSAKSKAKKRARRATSKAKTKRKLVRAKAKARRRPVAKRKAAPRRKTAAKRKTGAKKKTAARTKSVARKKTAPRRKAARKATPKAKARRASKPQSAPSAAPRALKPRPAKPAGKTIVLYPEAAFGPALNCVGIAQRLRSMGHNPVFVCDRGFKGVFAKYGFEENLVDMSGGMSDEEIANFWANFIAGHLPHFHLSPIEQLPTYVIPVWEAIVDSAIISHEGLTQHLARIKPDVVCVDNVILFPAIKRTGKPWIRIISCSENEIADPDIPPHLSGCSEGDYAGYARFENRFLELVRPTHRRFNEFLQKVGEQPYKLGEFFETSPWMNLLLYPEALRFKRRYQLDPTRFQYLDGCVRKEDRYTVPRLAANQDKPLIYVSFGSLGAADIDLYKRMIALFARLPYRFLMNVGDYLKEYANVPPNVHLASWYPQPAVLPHVDLFIHHGGNNSFNEALYFGKPAIIMPYCWDGLDNAARIDDAGYGAKLPRYDWTDDQFAGTIARLLLDHAMAARLATCSRQMQTAKGTDKAARIIADIAEAAERRAA
jgi:MGT family glycosyltransferase